MCNSALFGILPGRVFAYSSKMRYIAIMKAKGAGTMTGITYKQNGDYNIPNIILMDNGEPIGRYGRMRRSFLKENKSIFYNDLILTEKLFPHLREIEEVAQRRLELLIAQIKEQRGINEAMKEADAMRWVQEMNSIHACAEEIILSELIYA